MFLSTAIINGESIINWQCFVSGEGATSLNIPRNCTIYSEQGDTLIYENVTSMPGFNRCGEGEWLPVCREYSNDVYIGSNGYVSYIVTGEGGANPGWYTNPDVFGMYVDSSGRLGTYSGVTGDSAGYSYNAGEVIERYTNLTPETNFNVIDELEKSVAAFSETQTDGDNETSNKPCGSRDNWYCSKETVRTQINDYCSANASNKYCQTRSSN